MQKVHLRADRSCESLTRSFSAAHDVLGHDWNIARREGWGHGAPLFPPRLAFTHYEAPAGNRAQYTASEGQAHVVFTMREHDVSNRIRRGCERYATSRGFQGHNGLFQAALRERLVGIVTQS